MADYNPWITEWISVSDEEEELIQALNLDVSDSITIAEDVIRNRVIDLSVSESITAAENVAKILPRLDFSDSDSITLTESTTPRIMTIKLSVNESITLAEYTKPLIVALNLSVNDSIILAENRGYVKVLKTLGTAPYKFHSATITAEGRLWLEEK